MKPLLFCVFLDDPMVAACEVFAITVLLLAIILCCCCYKKKLKAQKDEANAARAHELKMKEQAFDHQKFWHSEGEKTKEEELKRKIKEFNELTIHQKLLDKVIEKKTDEEIKDLKKTLEELKTKYESLYGEIEQIIIKKKQ